MDVEYITMFKDYGHGRHKSVKKFVNHVEKKLVCAVCLEKMSVDFGSIKGLDIISTQAMWNLL